MAKFITTEARFFGKGAECYGVRKGTTIDLGGNQLEELIESDSFEHLTPLDDEAKGAVAKASNPKSKPKPRAVPKSGAVDGGSGAEPAPPSAPQGRTMGAGSMVGSGTSSDSGK